MPHGVSARKVPARAGASRARPPHGARVSGGKAGPRTGIDPALDACHKPETKVGLKPAWDRGIVARDMGHRLEGAKPERPRRAGGFTLLELLVLVCTLSLAATLLVPAVRHYLRRARAYSVLPQLARICAGARAYYEESDSLLPTEPGQAKRPKRFPESTAVTPARKCCEQSRDGRCRGTDWDTATWRALGFEITGPHRFRFQFLSSGLGTKARFTARAHGDLDCDGLESTFERVGWVDAKGRVQLGVAVRAVHQEE